MMIFDFFKFLFSKKTPPILEESVLFDAEKARKKTKEGIESKTDTIIKEIMQNISNACANGVLKTQLNLPEIDGTFNKQKIFDTLKELGYITSDNTTHGNSFDRLLNISWITKEEHEVACAEMSKRLRNL